MKMFIILSCLTFCCILAIVIKQYFNPISAPFYISKGINRKKNNKKDVRNSLFYLEFFLLLSLVLVVCTFLHISQK